MNNLQLEDFEPAFVGGESKPREELGSSGDGGGFHAATDPKVKHAEGFGIK